MRRHKRVSAAGLAAALALTTAGCSGGTIRGAQDAPPPGKSPATPAETTGATKDATFVYLPDRNVVTDWDPASAHSGEIVVMQNVYESLTVYDPRTGKPEPRLATGWTSSPDRLTWTFRLRDGVTFHTGRPVDAAAVKASIERTRKTGAEAARIWDAVDGIEARDAGTLVFTLSRPAPLDLVASAGYGAYVYDTAAAGSGDLKKWFAQGRDAGSGPYTVGSWRAGGKGELTLKSFDGYWGGWKGAHYTEVAYRVTPSPTPLLLQRQEASFIPRPTPELLTQAENQGARVSRTPSFENLLALLNTRSGPLREVKVRQAVQKVIDYDALLTAVGDSIAPVGGLIPEGLPGFAQGDPPKQDLAGAQELLTRAGYGPDMNELTLTLTYARDDDGQRRLVTLLAAALKRLNVTLKATPLSRSAQWERARAADPAERQDILLTYWHPDYADASSWFADLFRSAEPVSFNVSYLNDPAVDGAVDALPKLPPADVTAAEQAYADLQRRIVTEEAAVAVPYARLHRHAYSGSIQGYVDNPAYPDVVFVHGLTPGD
ncbi:ABC transporter substrate-binding protein [Streptosporangium sp. NPDC051022]|uniref:ABC transporter substrate-binding protein n=1 Tax=Streptosporangium sp. NPDC051022 TaxID=3155752 RepID=UPI003421CB05